MSKIVAFVAAFIVTLVVVLVPVASFDLSQSGTPVT